ncbi:hypothetical protein B0H16DRAFT_1480556 [Mycena metata]|uniref:Uncharacterized protein n=1 Tax=Mycena metata TaxID=1033252 RepID=A0AAD7H3N4_9AGAR|nr:hypothetical protein B0H16DRAFT_1480556 [Mycena metata]
MLPTCASPRHPNSRQHPSLWCSAHSPHRLILRWTDSPPSTLASVTSLAGLLDTATIEQLLPPHVQGVNWTRNSNLVIHTCAPYTASQLAAVHGKAVMEVVHRECGGFEGPAVLEVNMPWVGVVVHGVPAKPLLDSLKFKEEDF